jgi:hypothetical protein
MVAFNVLVRVNNTGRDKGSLIGSYCCRGSVFNSAWMSSRMRVKDLCTTIILMLVYRFRNRVHSLPLLVLLGVLVYGNFERKKNRNATVGRRKEYNSATIS